MTTPQKEVIYVDTEDDITSVIGKVKSAKAPIIALVPPKRIGMLQSIVNLKLVRRSAELANKRLVIITNDSALTALAAGVSIPVAKNLQSKPEIAPITALNVDDEEVIDGETLPVGDHAEATLAIPGSSPAASPTAVAPIAAEKAVSSASLKKDAKKTKIPDFNIFKKRVLLIGGGLIALGAFLIWAIWFAPQATVTIAAKTTPYNVSQQTTARAGVDFDADEAILPAEIASKKQTKSVEFTATGKKEVGEKATGSVEMEICVAGLGEPSPISAGATVSAGSNSYTTNEAATFSYDHIGTGCIVYKSSSVAITADKRGTSSNVSDASFTVSNSSATATGSASGGTDKTVTVVSDADVAKARDELSGVDEDALKAELVKEFEGKDVIVIEESFRVDVGDPSVSPAVGEEASKATATAEITYQIAAIAKTDVEKIIDINVKEQLEGLPGQRIYSHGVNEVRVSQLNIENGNYRFVIETTAYVGPQINESELAEQLVGKVEGEIQEVVKSRDGVQSVEVNFSPFWVNKVGSAEKITIKFDVENAQ